VSDATLFPEAEMPQTQLAVVETSPGQLIREVIKSGITAESVGVVERLVALAERQEARQAEKDFNVAFNALQSEMPVIKAMKPVEGKDKNTGAAFIKYHFAPYEDIMEQVRPLLLKNGFSVSFSMGFNEGRIIQNCTLAHIAGHSRTNTFMARIGSGPPGSSEAQGDGAASTYAKRFALCNALNIVTERDTDGADARKEGSPITFEQVQYIKDLIAEVGADEGRFMRLAGVSKVEDIGSEKYDLCVVALGKKRKAT
jgi:hypothetical protein